jgi:hypothetical protein
MCAGTQFSHARTCFLTCTYVLSDAYQSPDGDLVRRAYTGQAATLGQVALAPTLWRPLFRPRPCPLPSATLSGMLTWI